VRWGGHAEAVHKRWGPPDETQRDDAAKATWLAYHNQSLGTVHNATMTFTISDKYGLVRGAYMTASRDHGMIVDAFLEWNRILAEKYGPPHGECRSRDGEVSESGVREPLGCGSDPDTAEGQSAWVFRDKSVLKVSVTSGPNVAGAYLAYVNPLFARVFAEGIDARY
jgi:hypothetical protein